jgi:hypothetical protein
MSNTATKVRELMRQLKEAHDLLDAIYCDGYLTIEREDQIAALLGYDEESNGD